MFDLLIATSNKGKWAEFQTYIRSLPIHLRYLADFSEIIEVEETGSSFEENATLKATGYAKQTRLWALGDDSGLEVDAFGGAPGIYSSRFGGEGLTDAGRTEKLLRALRDTHTDNRSARFVCVIVIADPTGVIAHTAHGECRGQIADAPRGSNGFGYDPVFIPEGYAETLGELNSEIKAGISHRGKALAVAMEFLSRHPAAQESG